MSTNEAWQSNEELGYHGCRLFLHLLDHDRQWYGVLFINTLFYWNYLLVLFKFQETCIHLTLVFPHQSLSNLGGNHKSNFPCTANVFKFELSYVSSWLFWVRTFTIQIDEQAYFKEKLVTTIKYKLHHHHVFWTIFCH